MKTEIAITSINEGYELVSRALYSKCATATTKCSTKKEIIIEFEPVPNIDNIKSIKIIFKLSKGENKCIGYTKYFTDGNSESGKMLIFQLEEMLLNYYSFGHIIVAQAYTSYSEKSSLFNFIKENMPPYYITKLVVGYITMRDIKELHKIYKLKFNKFKKKYPKTSSLLTDVLLPNITLSPKIGSEPIYFISSSFSGVTTDGLACTLLNLCKEYINKTNSFRYAGVFKEEFINSLELAAADYTNPDYIITSRMGPRISYYPNLSRKDIICLGLIHKPVPIEYLEDTPNIIENG